ncbi:universal stress protein [Saccharopolyspora sp. NPDC049426]|uniref:universal stress protein n=1 Tax=Saccharopolyspora sp. NPDC049426 TaxID=3155652 RepID=UPI00343EF88D
MTAKQDLPVLVGVDGSEPSLAAAVWAAEEAYLRHAPARLVAVGNDSAQDEEVRASLSNAAEHCREKHSQVEVVEEIEHGSPTGALIRCSAEARLLVVGSRGRGNLAEVVLGSVSTAVAMRARCPVAVIRDRRTSFSVGPVVVGVDGSASSRSALQFAFDAATARQADLLAIYAWRPENAGRSRRDVPQRTVWFSLDDAQRELAAQLGRWRESHPDVVVREEVRFGHPVEELVSAASHAQVLVVGHRGMGGFERLLLGSVAHGVLHHAECPVVVVRPGQTT